jgi:hypothetical protein
MQGSQLAIVKGDDRFAVYFGHRVREHGMEHIRDLACDVGSVMDVYEGRLGYESVGGFENGKISVYVSDTGLHPWPVDLYDPISGTSLPGAGGLGEVRLALDVVRARDVGVLVHE